MLLRLLNVAGSMIGGEAVHGLWVLEINLVGPTQLVESLQVVALLAEEGAPRFLRATGLLGSIARACMVYSLTCERSTVLWLAEREGYVGVLVRGREREAAVQEILGGDLPCPAYRCGGYNSEEA